MNTCKEAPVLHTTCNSTVCFTLRVEQKQISIVEDILIQCVSHVSGQCPSGRCERMQVGICCGPQCNDSCCSGCCSCDCCNCCAAMKVKGDNCCSCDCDCCTPKLFGCQTLCCHCTFVRCPRCCDCCCCCCVEEQLRMDGDCVPFPKKEVIDTQPTKQS